MILNILWRQMYDQFSKTKQKRSVWALTCMLFPKSYVQFIRVLSYLKLLKVRISYTIKYYWLYLKLTTVNHVHHIDRYVIKILMRTLTASNPSEHALWCWLFTGFSWKHLWNTIKVITAKHQQFFFTII